MLNTAGVYSVVAPGYIGSSLVVGSTQHYVLSSSVPPEGTILTGSQFTTGTVVLAGQTVVTATDGNSYTMIQTDLPLLSIATAFTYAQPFTPLTLPLHKSILDIDEVKWTKKPWKLLKVSVTKWQVNPYWEWIAGIPTEYATDYSINRIALNYRATEADTLRLSVKRMPLTDLTLDADEPEFRENYHDFMLNGILMHMYGKQDAQCFDGEKKDTYERKFFEDVDNIKQQEQILDQRLKPNAALDAFR
jgi:hypothetical protein